nr:hypothetical protein [Micromonospora sp. DSM 115978]
MTSNQGFSSTDSSAVPEPTVPAAEPLVLPTMLSPDTVLDRRYRLRNPVTTRGPVTLWRGDDEVLARAVAIRVVEHGGGGDGTDIGDRVQAGRMLLEAAVNSGRLVHPGAASTYDATVTTTDTGQV